MPQDRAMIYVTAESLAEGAAAHVHVNEIMAGLERRGWRTELIQPRYASGDRRPNLLERLGAIMSVNRRAAAKLGEVSAIYCRANPLLAPIAWLARRRGVVVIHECNGPYADIAIAHPWTRAIFPLFAGLQRWQYRNADGVVAVTERLRQWLEGERGRPGVRLISNAANTELFTPEASPEPPVAGPYAVFFGALAAWHGAGTMVEAAAHPAWPEGVGLVVIGDGADSAKVAAAAASNPRIVHLGRQPYRRIPHLIVPAIAGLVAVEDVGGRAATGLAPLKLFETLAAGLPVIATDWPTQADFVREHDCGIVIPPADPGALASAVARLAADPSAARAMGARGRAAVVALHSWDHRADEVDSMLSALRASKHDR